MSGIALEKKHAHKLPMGVLAAALLPDGNKVAAACMDGVYLTSLDNSTQPRRLYGHQSYVSSVCAIDERLIVSAGYDGMGCWYDLSTDQEVRRVKLHDFWSWDMELSPNKQLLASVTGQYFAGGYKYEPQPEREPSIRVIDVASGDVRLSLPHVPSVQAVAFSPDHQFVAAGNLMGEVRVFRASDGEQVANWTTPAFTSWGIIKSHCYLGGIFSLQFTPDGNEMLLAGMGPMHDPMAGNGKQLWQKWAWQESEPKLVDQTHDGESGEGLMETLAIHPDGDLFVMAGRLRGGDWNAALFDLKSGARLAMLKTDCRVTQAIFTPDGKQLLLVGTQGQPQERKDGKFPDFGRVDVFEISRPAAQDAGGGAT
jgi:WD40 repeat protein